MHIIQGLRGSHLQLPGAEAAAGRAGGKPVPGFRSHSGDGNAFKFAVGGSWAADVTVEHGSLGIKDSSTQAMVLQCQLAQDTVR